MALKLSFISKLCPSPFTPLANHSPLPPRPATTSTGKTETLSIDKHSTAPPPPPYSASKSTATRSTRGEDTSLQTSTPKHDDEGCSNTKRAVPASRNPHDRCRASFGEGKGRIPEPSDALRKRARCRCPATARPLLRFYR